MKFKYLCIGLILLLSANNVSAGLVDYTTLGIYSHNSHDTIRWKGGYDVQSELYYSMPFYWGECTCDGYMCAKVQRYDYSAGSTINRVDGNYVYCNAIGSPSIISDYNLLLGNLDYISIYTGTFGDWSCYSHGGTPKVSIRFYAVGTDVFTISGITCGVNNVSLYHGGTILLNYDDLSDNSYSFSVTNNTVYKLIFSDGHEYEFTIDGANIEYDRNVCTYITLNFRDNCNNLITDTEFQYCNHGDTIVCYFVNTSSGTYDILFEDQDYLEIWTYSHIGELYYNITNPQDISYTVSNPTISWNNNIFVKDLNNSIIVEDALVSFSQDCIIDNSLYPTRNKYTNIDGCVIFDQCELDMAYITVSKEGYKTFSDSISPINLNALKNGQTTIVNLYPVDDALNESEYTSTNYNTYIYFKDNSSHCTNSILDTDDYVDLYYYNNNSDEGAMTLQFYKTNIYTGKTSLLNWNIPYEEEGYKRILKSNYTQTNYGYYGYLYSNSIEGWNIKKRLTVSNNTIEVIDHYQNLTKNICFINKDVNDSIDYRNEIKIIAYAKSNYSFLHDMTLKLYDNNVLIESITLDVFDFITSDIENYYEWDLGYNYTKDHNYTVNMYGYDDTFLKSDYINAIDLRKNKLTIIVKDRVGDTLINSYIFLEGYPSLTTSNTYYNSYENLDNGNYRYKASKSGYTSGGWDNINIIDSDNTVVYTLSYDSGSDPITQTKLSDNDLQKIFTCLMTILIIFILLGGLTHVAK